MVYYALQMEADREKLLVLRTNMTEKLLAIAAGS